MIAGRAVSTRPRRAVRIAFCALAWVFALGIVLQVMLAGVSLFVDGNRWRLHANVGHSFLLPLLSMLLLSVLGGLPRRLGWLVLAAISLMMIQGATAAMGGWPAVVHPVNAMLLFWLSLDIVRQAHNFDSPEGSL